MSLYAMQRVHRPHILKTVVSPGYTQVGVYGTLVSLVYFLDFLKVTYMISLILCIKRARIMIILQLVCAMSDNLEELSIANFTAMHKYSGPRSFTVNIIEKKSSN